MRVRKRGCLRQLPAPVWRRHGVRLECKTKARHAGCLPACLPACLQDTFDPTEFGDQPSQRMATVLVYLSGAADGAA